MLNYFKQSFISQQITIVVMAIVLWLPAFFSKSAFMPGEYNTPLYNIMAALVNFSPIITNVIAFAVYLTSIFLFNSILSANRLVNKNSTIGAFTFTLMMCCSGELHSCYPFIMACPFILMTMHTLFLIYQTDTPENYMMNVGYFIAIASLFYYPSVFLLIWVLISFFILGFNSLRHAMIPVTGFMLVNLILIGVSFLFGGVDNLLNSYSLYFRNIDFSFSLSSSEMVILSINVVLFIVSLLIVLGNNSDKGTNVRKRIGVAIALTFFAAFMLFVNKPLMSNMLIFMMFSFFYAIALSEIKKSRIANIVMFLMLLMIIANQYLPLLSLTI